MSSMAHSRLTTSIRNARRLAPASTLASDVVQQSWGSSGQLQITHALTCHGKQNAGQRPRSLTLPDARQTRASGVVAQPPVSVVRRLLTASTAAGSRQPETCACISCLQTAMIRRHEPAPLVECRQLPARSSDGVLTESVARCLRASVGGGTTVWRLGSGLQPVTTQSQAVARRANRTAASHHPQTAAAAGRPRIMLPAGFKVTITQLLTFEFEGTSLPGRPEIETRVQLFASRQIDSCSSVKGMREALLRSASCEHS